MVPPPLKLSARKGTGAGYTLVQNEDTHTPSDNGLPSTPVQQRQPLPQPRRLYQKLTLKTALIALITAFLIFVALHLVFATPSYTRHPSDGNGATNCDCPAPTPTVPQYFQTSPQLWAGPMKTGAPAFLAQTRIFDPAEPFVPNAPLQTTVPVAGFDAAHNASIFQMMGYLSPYQPAPDGFGVGEWPLPRGADIVQVQMLSRHGARYPTSGPGSNVQLFGERVADAKARRVGGLKAKGPLAFLNEWEYLLGYEILVPKGRQELFDSGVLHSYMYASLYNPNSKIIVRTTTQDRMLKSAEYFMAGFFGLEWTKNATIEVIIEEQGFNNSLAGSLACPNSHKEGGVNATAVWVAQYLQNATARLNSMIEGYDWTTEDTYAAQTMCPYETVSYWPQESMSLYSIVLTLCLQVAYGFSQFCSLFTYEEWIGFSYSVGMLSSHTQAKN